jgi:hypothetical protein
MWLLSWSSMETARRRIHVKHITTTSKTLPVQAQCCINYEEILDKVVCLVNPEAEKCETS